MSLAKQRQFAQSLQSLVDVKRKPSFVVLDWIDLVLLNGSELLDNLFVFRSEVHQESAAHVVQIFEFLDQQSFFSVHLLNVAIPRLDLVVKSCDNLSYVELKP